MAASPKTPREQSLRRRQSHFDQSFDGPQHFAQPRRDPTTAGIAPTSGGSCGVPPDKGTLDAFSAPTGRPQFRRTLAVGFQWENLYIKRFGGCTYPPKVKRRRKTRRRRDDGDDAAARFGTLVQRLDDGEPDDGSDSGGASGGHDSGGDDDDDTASESTLDAAGALKEHQLQEDVLALLSGHTVPHHDTAKMLRGKSWEHLFRLRAGYPLLPFDTFLSDPDFAFLQLLTVLDVAESRLWRGYFGTALHDAVTATKDDASPTHGAKGKRQGHGRRNSVTGGPGGRRHSLSASGDPKKEGNSPTTNSAPSSMPSFLPQRASKWSMIREKLLDTPDAALVSELRRVDSDETPPLALTVQHPTGHGADLFGGFEKSVNTDGPSASQLSSDVTMGASTSTMAPMHSPPHNPPAGVAHSSSSGSALQPTPPVNRNAVSAPAKAGDPVREYLLDCFRLQYHRSFVATVDDALLVLETRAPGRSLEAVAFLMERHFAHREFSESHHAQLFSLVPPPRGLVTVQTNAKVDPYPMALQSLPRCTEPSPCLVPLQLFQSYCDLHAPGAVQNALRDVFALLAHADTQLYTLDVVGSSASGGRSGSTYGSASSRASAAPSLDGGHLSQLNDLLQSTSANPMGKSRSRLQRQMWQSAASTLATEHEKTKLKARHEEASRIAKSFGLVMADLCDALLGGSADNVRHPTTTGVGAYTSMGASRDGAPTAATGGVSEADDKDGLNAGSWLPPGVRYLASLFTALVDEKCLRIVAHSGTANTPHVRPVPADDIPPVPRGGGGGGGPRVASDPLLAKKHSLFPDVHFSLLDAQDEHGSSRNPLVTDVFSSHVPRFLLLNCLVGRYLADPVRYGVLPPGVASMSTASPERRHLLRNAGALGFYLHYASHCTDVPHFFTVQVSQAGPTPPAFETAPITDKPFGTQRTVTAATAAAMANAAAAAAAEAVAAAAEAEAASFAVPQDPTVNLPRSKEGLVDTARVVVPQFHPRGGPQQAAGAHLSASTGGRRPLNPDDSAVAKEAFDFYRGLVSLPTALQQAQTRLSSRKGPANPRVLADAATAAVAAERGKPHVDAEGRPLDSKEKQKQQRVRRYDNSDYFAASTETRMSPMAANSRRGRRFDDDGDGDLSDDSVQSATGSPTNDNLLPVGKVTALPEIFIAVTTSASGSHASGLGASSTDRLARPGAQSRTPSVRFAPDVGGGDKPDAGGGGGALAAPPSQLAPWEKAVLVQHDTVDRRSGAYAAFRLQHFSFVAAGLLVDWVPMAMRRPKDRTLGHATSTLTTNAAAMRRASFAPPLTRENSHFTAFGAGLAATEPPRSASFFERMPQWGDDPSMMSSGSLRDPNAATGSVIGVTSSDAVEGAAVAAVGPTMAALMTTEFHFPHVVVAQAIEALLAVVRGDAAAEFLSLLRETLTRTLDLRRPTPPLPLGVDLQSVKTTADGVSVAPTPARGELCATPASAVPLPGRRDSVASYGTSQGLPSLGNAARGGDVLLSNLNRRASLQGALADFAHASASVGAFGATSASFHTAGPMAMVASPTARFGASVPASPSLRVGAAKHGSMHVPQHKVVDAVAALAIAEARRHEEFKASLVELLLERAASVLKEVDPTEAQARFASAAKRLLGGEGSTNRPRRRPSVTTSPAREETTVSPSPPPTPQAAALPASASVRPPAAPAAASVRRTPRTARR